MLIWRNIDLKLLGALLMAAARERHETISKPAHPAIHPTEPRLPRSNGPAVQSHGKKATCHVRSSH